MTTRAASMWEVRLAKWLHLGVIQSLERVRADRRTSQGVSIRLDKLLLLVDVLKHALLPRWLPPRLLSSHGAEWYLPLLQDQGVRNWLWQEVFLHLAKDPMALAKGLVPTGSALAAATAFDGLLPQAPVPTHVIDRLERIGARKHARSLKTLGRFDARIHGVQGGIHLPMKSESSGNGWDGCEEDVEEGPSSVLDRDTYVFLERLKPRKQTVPAWNREHEWAR